jgi:hypothetical protein
MAGEGRDLRTVRSRPLAEQSAGGARVFEAVAVAGRRLGGRGAEAATVGTGTP